MDTEVTVDYKLPLLTILHHTVSAMVEIFKKCPKSLMHSEVKVLEGDWIMGVLNTSAD